MEKRERIFKGVITLLVLKSIWDGPKHGYLLENEINTKLGEKLSEGEIYSLMKHMEIRGFVRSFTLMENSRMRRYYEITEKGKEFLIKHRHALEVVSPLINEISDFIKEKTNFFEGITKQ
ncbi:MAG: PadR family transcriptional regulator [Thermoplasmata archaeon]